MNYFLFLSIFLLSIFCHSNIHAQDDYAPATWISFNGDSISGWVQDHIIKGKFVNVKLAEEGKPIKKSANEISKVYQNNILSISSYTLIRSGEKENIFLELLISSGDMGLYRGKDDVLGKIYAVQKNKQFTVLMQHDLTSSYTYLYGDCSKISLTENFAYTEKRIAKVFEDYIDCQNTNIVSYVKPRKKQISEILIGPKLGYTFGNYSFPDNAYFGRGEYSTISSPKIGVTAQIVMSKKLNFQTELSYLNKKASSDSVNTPPIYIDPDIYSNFVEYDLSFIDWQFGLNYVILMKGDFTTSLGLGMNLGFLINSDFTQEANGWGLGETGPPRLDFDSSLEVGAFAVIGGNYRINGRNLIQLSMKFNMTEMDYFVNRDSDIIGGYGAGSTSLYSKMFEISLNYLFKIR